MKTYYWLLVVAIALHGCSHAPAVGQQRDEMLEVEWDLSDNRSTTALTGGNWTPSKSGLPDYMYIYHIKEIERFCLVLESGEKCEIDGVADVFAHRTGDMISEVIVNLRETSTDNAIAELRQLNKRWKGEGIGDIDSWRADASRGSLRRHNSLIRSLRSGASLEVMASILTGFESEASRFIQVSFSWPRLAADKEIERPASGIGSKETTKSERLSRIEWNFSSGRKPRALRGGMWTPILQKLGNYIFVYEVEQLAQFRLVLESGHQFDFDDIDHVSASRRGDNITQVAVETRGMSLPQAIDEVSRMHEQWKGKGLGDVSAWQQDVARGSERGHDSLIRTSQMDGEPEIMASIFKDRESDDDIWRIKVTYDWPKVGHADSADKVKSELSKDASTGRK